MKINHTIKRFLTLTLLALSVNANSVFEYGNTADYKTITFNKLKLALKNNNVAGQEKITKEEKRVRKAYIKKKAQLLGLKIATVESKNLIKNIFSNRETIKTLDSLYPIQKLIFKQNFLPPVIDYLQNSLLKKDDNTLRSTKFVFKKIKSAKVVTNNYSWRNYFYYFLINQNDIKIHFDAYINSTSTPLNKTELIYWHDNIEKGYQKGFSFMKNNLKSYFAELNRDFQGFLLFYILQDQGLIQPIKILSNKEKYIVKENELRIGDELFLLSDPNFDIERYLNNLKRIESRNAIY
jgi:hypothetical protein